MALQRLSEADVRLRLYPSTGRVVKVTEGYWPERRDWPSATMGPTQRAEKVADLVRRGFWPPVVQTPGTGGCWRVSDGKRWAPITIDALLSDEARLPIADELQRYFRSEAARHFRLKAMGMPCDCTVCQRGSDDNR